MTTSTEAPWAPELPLAHSLESTPVTVVEWSHADVLHALDTPSKYTQLIREHAEMMRAGKSFSWNHQTSLVKLGIESWKNQKHHGLFMALSTPAEQEMENFKGFLLALGLDQALQCHGSETPNLPLRRTYPAGTCWSKKYDTSRWASQENWRRLEGSLRWR